MELIDKMIEKSQRSKRIIEGIVPGFARSMVGKGIEAEGFAKIAQGMGGEIRPSCASELEGVDPRTKGVTGKGAEEAFFGSVSVGDHRALSKSGFQGWPERKERRCFGEVFGRDSVDFLGGPGDFLIAMEEGDEGIVNALFQGPGAETDLHRSVGATAGGAGGFEVDGGEDGLGNLDDREIVRIVILGKLVFQLFGDVGPDFAEGRVVGRNF